MVSSPEEVGFMVTSHSVSWFQGYSLLGERVGYMGTPHWGRWWVAWLFPTGGEGGLHGYSPLGEMVGCMVTPH